MKKGITIMSMSIVILVTIILATTVIITASNIAETSNKIKFVAEVENIQDAIQKYKNENGKYPELQKIDTDLANISEKELEQFASEPKIGYTLKFHAYIIDFDAIGIVDRYFGYNEDGMNNDVYVLSRETGRVYYLKGIKYNNIKYYTAAKEISGNDYNVKYETRPIEVDGILIYPSETELTKDAITITIRVPKTIEHFYIKPYANGITMISSKRLQEEIGYTVTLVNYIETKLKYYITMSYTYGGEEKEYTYYAYNIDESAPVIDITNKQITTVTQNGQTKRYLSGINFSDPESEIDVIKYELGEYYSYYFGKYGKILTDKKIDITGATCCTVYVKNKIGKESCLQIDVTPTE